MYFSFPTNDIATPEPITLNEHGPPYRASCYVTWKPMGPFPNPDEEQLMTTNLVHAQWLI